jgi:hypothetical protein
MYPPMKRGSSKIDFHIVVAVLEMWKSEEATVALLSELDDPCG